MCSRREFPLAGNIWSKLHLIRPPARAEVYNETDGGGQRICLLYELLSILPALLITNTGHKLYNIDNNNQPRQNVH